MIVLRRNIQSEVDAPGDDADADADAGAAPKAEALKPTAPAPKPTAPAPAPTKTAPAKSQAASKASKGDPAHSATPSGSTDAVGGEKALGKAAQGVEAPQRTGSSGSSGSVSSKMPHTGEGGGQQEGEAAKVVRTQQKTAASAPAQPKTARGGKKVVFEKHPPGFIPKQYKQMPLKHFLQHSSNSSSSSSSGSNRNGD